MNYFEKVKEILVENLGCDVDDINLDTDLQNDLGADSLDAVELSMALEDEFGLEISDEELSEFKTVGDIVRYCESRA